MFLYLSMIETEEEKCKFVQIYENYQYFMWYVANEVLQDKYLAEDAVQDAFLALTRHLDKVEEVKSTKTKNFIATIVKSKAIDILRKKKGQTEEYEEGIVGESREDILDNYIQKEDHESLVEAIYQLDELYRVVFEYKYLHEFSDREIAQILEVTPKVVNVRLFRGKKKLREILAKEGI
ncbi:RNA polymerase sigma factor [Konateibacter massiliensis]|uniref:RNA polymerase sigma factor n=1 Tax=Konateibacter massiliensis TaxID=2002841 RepID=UPI0015D4EE89|nr:sigma-70 family RNA polymerase sigma factor [Konateibacter massiliensis]